MAEEGFVLTEAQVVAMGRPKSTNEANGEIQTEHPGYLGSQDMYYVGTIKGIGRVVNTDAFCPENTDLKCPLIAEVSRLREGRGS